MKPRLNSRAIAVSMAASRLGAARTGIQAFMPRVTVLLKWLLIVTGTVLLLVVLFWRSLMGFVLHDLPFMGRSFDAKAWSTALKCTSDKDCIDKDMACVRGSMFRDLSRKHLTPGVPRSQVLALLGEPTLVTKDNCVDYELGYCSGFKIDGDYLRVCYDQGDKVSRVFHWQS